MSKYLWASEAGILSTATPDDSNQVYFPRFSGTFYPSGIQMILSSILLFSLAASLGLFLVVLGTRYHRSSAKIGLIHASMGLLAFGLLIAQIVSGVINKYNNVAALLMILALTGGFLLFALREHNKPPPMVLVAIHAGMALVGLLVLYIGFSTTK